MSAADPSTALDELRELYGIWGFYLQKLGHRKGDRAKIPIEEEWNQVATKRAAAASRTPTS